MSQDRQQAVPIRIYQSDKRIMLAAPLPGLEPEDISVTVSGDRVTISGEYRGVREDERDVLVAEWGAGPYYREITLPEPVDGSLTNATFGNGVLVLAMPKLGAGQAGPPKSFGLRALEPTRGEHVGHVGQHLHPTTTEEHRRQVELTARSAGSTMDAHGRS